jgi:hypothetical protein
MKDMTFAGQNPRTEREYEAEIDRLGAEIRQMLDETKRNNDESKRLGQLNREALERLEKLVLCSKD